MLAATAMLGVLATTHASAAAKHPPPVGASLVGARVAPVPGQSKKAAVLALEQQLGTKVPVVSEYPHWNSTFPNRYYKWLRNSGHQLVLMLKLKLSNGFRPKWADLANAQPGDQLYADMVRWADGFKAYRAPLYVVFHKEPNEPANKVAGNAADYKAAWARMVTFMKSQGVTNVTWVFAMAGGVYAKLASTWYPGNHYVDIIASTGMGSCTTSSCTQRTQASIMAPMVAWAAQYHPHKRIAVAESGQVESTSDPNAKADWINATASDLRDSAYQGLEFIIYRHYQQYRLDTSAAALKAGSDWFSSAYWRS
jgi:hypothetical protein